MVTGVVRRGAVLYTLALNNIRNAGSDLGAERERERLGQQCCSKQFSLSALKRGRQGLDTNYG